MYVRSDEEELNLFVNRNWSQTFQIPGSLYLDPEILNSYQNFLILKRKSQSVYFSLL